MPLHFKVPMLSSEKLNTMGNLLFDLKDKWEWMTDQDPHPESVVGKSRHRTIAMTVKTGPASDNDELIGAVEEQMQTPPLGMFQASNEMMGIH